MGLTVGPDFLAALRLCEKTNFRINRAPVFTQGRQAAKPAQGVPRLFHFHLQVETQGVYVARGSRAVMAPDVEKFTR